jgi:hypothetical protein
MSNGLPAVWGLGENEGFSMGGQLTLSPAHVFDIIPYVALGLGIAVLVRARISNFWLKALVATTLTSLAIYLGLLSRSHLFGLDYQFFWRVGSDVWRGVDPYHDTSFGRHPFLNPPTALPLFALFAALPLPSSLATWTALNVVSALGLIVLALKVLSLEGQPDLHHARKHAELGTLRAAEIAALAVCLACSKASIKGFVLGQLSVLVAVMIVIALIAQARGRPVLAGICFAVATSKFVTMVPFLILFLRRADRSTWIALAAVVLVLCAATRGISGLPARAAALARRAEELSAPGKVNDYSFEGTRNESIISFEHLFYRMGMRDRDWIRRAQFMALAVVGTWVAFLVVHRKLPRPAAACVVSFLALLFLYHRDYDTVILALPLIYCTGKAELTSGSARWLYIACGLMVLAILNADALYLRYLTQASLGWGIQGRFVQAIVLPYATWLSLLAMPVLVLAARAEGGHPKEMQPAGAQGANFSRL